jgi:hypothetical protein
MAFDLPAPLNYKFDTQDPAESVRKSIELGIGIQNADQQRQLHAAQMAEIQQKLHQQQTVEQQDQDFQSRLGAVSQKKGGPTSDDILGLLSTPTGLRHSADIQQNYKNTLEKEQKTIMSTLIPGYAALSKGQYGVAEDTFRTASQAAKNSGNDTLAKTLGDHADMIAKNPGLATSTVGMAGEAINKGFIESYGAQAGQGDTLRKGTADADSAVNTAKHANALSLQDIATKRAAELSSNASTASTNLATDTARRTQQADIDVKNLAGAQAAAKVPFAPIEAQDAADVSASGAATARAQTPQAAENAQIDLEMKRRQLNGLPADSVKTINELGKTISDSTRDANIGQNLMDNINKKLVLGGYPARGWEYLKNIAGKEDVSSVIRKQLAQYTNQDLLKMFPPGGRLNEEIIDQMRKGTFDLTANPEAAKTMVEGIVAKKRADATLGSVEKQWTQSNWDTRSAKTDGKINVNGVDIPYQKNQDYNDFLSKKVYPLIREGAGGTATPLPPSRIQAAKEYLTHKDADPWRREALRTRLAITPEAN